MTNQENEIELLDYLRVIWKRKWLIIIPTLILVFGVGVYSFSLPKKWETEALIMPSKFIIRSEQGQFDEIMIAKPKQLVEQINAGSYNHLIAAELGIKIQELPKLKAENIKDTKLVRITTKENDVEKSKIILNSLFNHLKKDMDTKINVEIKELDTQISTKENLITHKKLLIKDNLTEIKLEQIEKTKTQQEISSAENKLKISEERVKNVLVEMKEVKKGIDELENQLKKVLAEKKEGNQAISLLLYSNEVQNNLRYYNSLDERLNTEKITQEDLNLFKRERKESIKQFDAQIEKLRIEIDKINNGMENTKNQIALLREKKARIDYAQLIKKPTSSLRAISPKKKLNVMFAGIIGLMIFTILAFFFEYLEKQKLQTKE